MFLCAHRHSNLIIFLAVLQAQALLFHDTQDAREIAIPQNKHALPPDADTHTQTHYQHLRCGYKTLRRTLREKQGQHATPLRNGDDDDDEDEDDADADADDDDDDEEGDAADDDDEDEEEDGKEEEEEDQA